MEIIMKNRLFTNTIYRNIITLVLLSTLRINGFLDTALLYLIIPTLRRHQMVSEVFHL